MGRKEVCRILEGLYDEDRSMHMIYSELEPLKQAAIESNDLSDSEKNEVIRSANQFQETEKRNTARVQNLWTDLHCKEI